MQGFLNDEQIREIYEETLIKLPRTCIRCKNQCKLKKNSLTIIRCNKNGCRTDFSLLKKTPFYRFKKSSMISLRILEMYCNDYPNDLIANNLKVSNKTMVVLNYHVSF
ncbi:hypothetical protein H312_01113 [Anncaliia algerae PRA339]|uniref:Transposase zinc-ribbon domain-containing protein n=1 Tax=Anncaliia algerae PRA339 TaxID=1288291 RepID=A0A059F395_9MICR|nr:hypothetical protein H312_01113 [Anncaliia algerae PRA339]